MARSFRFTLNYSNKKDIICPNCRQKTFTPMLDLRSFQIDENFGICNRRVKCGYANYPSSDKGKKRYLEKEPVALPSDNIKVWARRELFSESLIEPQFTQIEPYPGTKAIQRLSIQQLVTLINHLPETTDKKLQANILKGIYYGSTKGEFCINPPNFLFFDIDLKAEAGKNLWLTEPKKRKLVRDILEEEALFVCDSFSKGLCGLLWVNDFNVFTNETRQTHKAVAAEIYHLLEDYIELFSAIKVKFDLMQGTFRQVRYFCRQKNKICLNMHPSKFYYSIGIYIEDYWRDRGLIALDRKNK